MSNISSHRRPKLQKNTSSSTAPSRRMCDLCGLSLRKGAVNATFSGTTYQFCCIGCRQVFSILLEATGSGDPQKFRETDLFKQCQEKGIIPRSEADLAADDFTNSANNSTPRPLDKDNPAELSIASAPHVLELNLKVRNMWCPACAWLIDQTLMKTRGIIDCACNFSIDRLQVTYNPVQTSPDQIIDSVKKIGYQAVFPDESQEAHARRKEFIRFAISAFLTMNVMMLSYALYTGFFTDFTPDTVRKLAWPAWTMATAVLVYGGFDLFKKAWFGIANAAFSMETLIIVGSLSAYGYSTINLISGSIHLYFDTASMLITLVLLGKTLERRAKGQVLEGLDNFFALKPTKVRICSDDYPDGRYVSADHLKKDDIFQVVENEIVAADGMVESGNGTVDESSLTGEPLPVVKKTGDRLRSGARVTQGVLKIRAEKVGADSTLGQMFDIIEKTLLTKIPLEGRTDAILQWFVPIIVIMAMGTAVICYLAGISMDDALLRAVTVLVISCPCALGIAIPLARVTGISIAGKKGILVRNFKAFEQAQRINAFVFDKTGTITEGKWKLLNIHCFDPFTEDQVLSLAAGLEKSSDHFIAAELRRQATKKNIQPAQPQNIIGLDEGVQGELNGQKIQIGSGNFLAAELAAVNFPDADRIQSEQSPTSHVYLGVHGRLAAVFIFGDAFRENAKSTVANLQSRGFFLALVSGDGDKTTKEVGQHVGIKTSHGGQLPQEKAAFVNSLQKNGYRVAMVGDGVNDSPALVQADLSIAVYSRGQLSKETADITLMRGDPGQVIEFLDFATMVNRKINQNLIFTFLYNLISIPIAISGLLNPLVAVTAMLLSSLSVTGNTLLLVRRNN
jgi:heavy metal translocating P-type ATPase